MEGIVVYRIKAGFADIVYELIVKGLKVSYLSLKNNMQPIQYTITFDITYFMSFLYYLYVKIYLSTFSMYY